MSNRKPHNHYAGYVFERKHPLGHIVIVVAEKQGIDSDGKYIVLLEFPEGGGQLGPDFTSIPKARSWAKDELAGESGYDWGLPQHEEGK